MNSWISWVTGSLPAGMMPIWSGHGCKVTAVSFSQSPASCCVRPIKPWSISLNMPSPPTHTTLPEENTGISVRKAPPGQLILLCCSADGSYPSKPVTSFLRRWSLAWFARSVTKQQMLWLHMGFPAEDDFALLYCCSPITWELIPASSNRGATREW